MRFTFFEATLKSNYKDSRKTSEMSLKLNGTKSSELTKSLADNFDVSSKPTLKIHFRSLRKTNYRSLTLTVCWKLINLSLLLQDDFHGTTT